MRSVAALRARLYDPLMSGSKRMRAMEWWSDLVCKHPVVVLVIFSLLAAGSVVLTTWKLEFQSDRNALISQDLEWNKRFIDWINHFGGTHDLTVVVDLDPANTGTVNDEADAEAKAFVRELAARLEAEKQVIKRVIWGFDTTGVSPKAVRLLPMAEFDRQTARLPEAIPVLVNPTPQALIGHALSEMQKQRNRDTTPEEAVRGLRELGGLLEAVRGAATEPSGPSLGARLEAAAPGNSGWEYLKSDNGRIYFLRAAPLLDNHSLNAFAPSITLTRRHISELLPRYTHINAGLTGIDVIEADETDAASFDSTYTSIVAAVLILVLMFGAFHGWRTPVIGMVALAYCIAIAFGFVTLGVGHLQIISVVFALMLLGLGVDYGIYLASRYELIRHDHPDTQEGFQAAMRDVFRTMGPGVITGAVTTAAAFATIIYTDFTGVAEMGLIAGVGIMICLVVMFAVFPALLALFKASSRHVVPMSKRRFYFYHEKWSMPFVRRAGLTVGVSVMILIASIFAISRMRFDYNLFNLLPRGSESVEWQNIIDRKGERSVYFGVSIVKSLDEARIRTQMLRTKGTVSSVGGIGMLFPEDDAAKIAKLEAMDRAAQLRPKALATLESEDDKETVSKSPDLLSQLAGMRLMLAGASLVQMPDEVRDELAVMGMTVNKAIEALSAMKQDEREAGLVRVQAQYSTWRKAVATRIAGVFDTSLLTPDDLPEAAVDVYRAADGRMALEIIPKLPNDPVARAAGPLEYGFMTRFIGDMRDVDPGVTGVMVQVYESGKLIKKSYQWAGMYALLIVFVLVCLDFWSVKDGVLSLVPVSMGFAATFGVMNLAGMQINPANIIVLPLMFGIGVDAGVHMLHRWKQDPTHRPLGLTSGTGKGVTITSLATMIGFGCMMLARHRGIQSLGFVLTLGLGMTLLACWFVMPAVLELIQRRRETKS